MGDYYFDKLKGRTSTSGAGTTAGVTVTVTGVAGQQATPLAIECSGDAAALVTLESPAATILYRKRFTAAFNFSERFDPGDIMGAAGANLLLKISASTANCEANLDYGFIGG